MFYSRLSEQFSTSPTCSVLRCSGQCLDASHGRGLDECWSAFIDTIQQVGKEVFGDVKSKKKCIPGWNMYITDVYAISRRSRAHFKFTLRQCRAEESKIRAEVLSSKLQGGNLVSFWKDVRSLTPSSKMLPQRVDEAVGEQNIVAMWQRKFSTVLNEVDDSGSKRDFLFRLSNVPASPVKHVTVHEL